MKWGSLCWWGLVTSWEMSAMIASRSPLAGVVSYEAQGSPMLGLSRRTRLGGMLAHYSNNVALLPAWCWRSQHDAWPLGVVFGPPLVVAGPKTRGDEFASACANAAGLFCSASRCSEVPTSIPPTKTQTRKQAVPQQQRLCDKPERYRR